MERGLGDIGSGLAVVLFGLMLAAIEAGRRMGRRRLKSDRETFSEGLGAAEGAIFALLGLLVAFTFSGAASRFEARRHLITEEANAMGTAWLRLDVLAAADQGPLRELFRRYAGLRVAAYQRVRDEKASAETQAATLELQGEMWRRAMAGVRGAGAAPGAAQVLLPALNEMFDIVTTRGMAMRNHPPLAIYLLLGVLCVVGSMLFGYSMGPHWLHRLSFAGITALAIYVILDLEFPRRGLIRIDGEDAVLVELRRTLDARP